MHTILPIDFFRVAHRTAGHFGFVPFESLPPPPRGQKPALPQKVNIADKKLDALQGFLTSPLAAYFERGLYTERPAFFFSINEVPRSGEMGLNLQIIGVRKSIAESLLIQTIRSLVRDFGYTNDSIRINSLGDQESVTRYSRELGGYLRKRLEDMPPEAREYMRDDVIAAFLCLLAQNHELCLKSPSPLEYLSDASRRHFREIIEHLDMTATPYEIDPRLIGHHYCYADTLFTLEFRDEQDAPFSATPLLVRGGRLDAFVKHFLKKDVPATGAVVILAKKYAPAHMPKPRRGLIPSVFMVQLGFGPKIRSLMLLDTLKSAGISVHQALSSDSLSEQLRQAEAYAVPYSIILGQKEFVENSIIVRDMRSRSQQNIPFETLVPHLKRLLKRV